MIGGAVMTSLMLPPSGFRVTCAGPERTSAMCNLMLASLALTVSLTTVGFAQQSRPWHQEQEPKIQSRRVAHHIPAGRRTTGGATYELVASTESCRLLALHSRLLAEDARAKRFMDAPRGAARGIDAARNPPNFRSWRSAPKARIVSGGRFHTESCRLIR
jgi:hypothetical protein